MAIALDANLGKGKHSGGGNLVFSTTAAAAAGTTILAGASWWNNTSSTFSVSGGGLSWSSVIQVNNTTSDRAAIWIAQAPSGLASGTSITMAITGGTALLGGLASFTGVGTLDTTGQSTGTTGTTWTSGSGSVSVVGNLLFGVCGNETTVSTTSTPTTGTELFDDWQTGDQQGWAGNYFIAVSTGSQSVGGTWSNSSTQNTGALAVYNAAAVSAQAIEAFSDFEQATFGPF